VSYGPDWLEESWRSLPENAFGAHSPVLLDEWQERALWEEACGTAAPGEFAGDRVALAAALQEAWALCREWRLDVAGFVRPASDEVELLMRSAAAFEERLRTGGWIGPAQLPEILAGAARTGAWRPESTAWLGYDEPTPAQRLLREAIREHGAFVETPAAEARAGEAALFSCADESTEIRAAARWARALLEGGEAGPIGIVFHGLGVRRGEIARVFCDVFGAEHTEPETALNGLVHVVLGRPLAECPVVAHALLALEMLAAPPDHGTLFRFLHAPFFAGGSSETDARARLELKLRAEQRERWPLPVLKGWAHDCPRLRRALDGVGEWLKDRPQGAAEWARWATQALGQLGWPGERALSSAEYQAVQAWHELLARFARLSAVSGPMSMHDAVRRISRMARERLFQPESLPAPVQVLGLPETAGLAFEHLWIAGALDEAWPASPRPNPFVPLALQRRLGMPHADAGRELEFARRVSRALLAAVPRVIVSHAQWRADEQLRASALFASLPPASGLALSGYAGRAPQLRAASPTLETYGDWRGPPLAELRPNGGVRIIADQAACPFRAFARHRLHAGAPETVAAGLDSLTHGTLVHEVLAAVWKELGSQRVLAALTDEEMRLRIGRHAAAALEKLDAHGDSFRQAVFEIEHRRLARLISAWLDFERRRPAFEVVGTEAPQTLRIGALELKLRADRIDRLKGGGRLIIDYKTGARKTSAAWLGDRPDEPQLPMYVIASQPPAEGIAFAALQATQPGFVGLASASGLADGVMASTEAKKDPIAWPDLVERWQRAVTELAGRFAAGEARVDPKKSDTCGRCDVMSLCRLRELRPRGALAEEEHPSDE
jgi:probable DNA repair protein